MHDFLALQLGALSSDGDPWSTKNLKVLKCFATEALAAPMTEKDQGVAVSEIGRIVGELEGANRPRVASGAAEDELAGERAMETGARSDQKNPGRRPKSLGAGCCGTIGQKPL
jgi:hypothetical protein